MDIRVYDHYPPGTAGGQCYRCRCHQRETDGDARERVVDLGVDIDHEGRIALCETCVVEIGHNLGMLTPAEADALREQVAELTARAEAAEVRAVEADDLFASLARYDERRAVGADSGAGEHDPDSASSEVGADSGADTASAKAPAKAAAGKPKAAAAKAAAGK